MTQAPVTLIALPLLALAMFVSIRRNLGRQRMRPARLRLRITFLSFAAIALACMPPFEAESSGALLAGVAAGAALALLGLRYTRFEGTAAGRFYYPNPYIGLLVSALFIGRIVYRMIVLAPAMQASLQGNAATQSMLLYSSRTPLTLALLGLVVGYYAAYCSGVLIRSGHAATTIEAAT